MSVTANANETMGAWTTRLVSYLAALTLLGLLGWVVITTKTNSDTLTTLSSQAIARELLQHERESRFTEKMGDVAAELSTVANNLRTISSEMYPRSEAEARFKELEANIKALEHKVADNTYRLKYAVPPNKK